MDIDGIVHRTTARQEVGDRTLRSWRRSGRVRTVGSWYVTDDAPPDVVAILARGLRPTCLDAAALYGLWVPPGTGVHVYRPRTSSRSTLPRGELRQIRRRRDPLSGRLDPSSHGPWGHDLVLHSPVLRAWPGHGVVPDLSLVLDHAGHCLKTAEVAILLESAIEQRALTLEEAREIVDLLPFHRRRALSRIRADAGSGTETMVRWWLETLHIGVRSQVWIPGVGRVDLLVGSGLVIECDSRSFHDNPEQYREDHRRDLLLRSLGYTVVRLTWEQVFCRTEETLGHLRVMLRRGDHRRPIAA